MVCNHSFLGFIYGSNLWPMLIRNDYPFWLGDPSLAAWLKISSSPRIQDRLHPKCVAWAKSAIEHCCRDHKNHYMGSAEPFCPKRLIDVQSEPVRLVLSTDMPSPFTTTPQYAALSYCWGPEAEAETQLKTTSDNLNEREAGISTEQMTPVLRDAVAVTRALTIPYLWVDALCILQNSDARSDWEEQSSVMHKIYAYAHVTLGALASDSCTKRFCSPAQPELHVRLRSSLRPCVTGLLKVSYLGYIRDVERSDLSASDFISANTDVSVWSYRAWTLQEQVLSTRFVGFGKQDLFFTCASSHCVMGEKRYQSLYWTQVGLSSQRWNGFSGWDSVTEEYSYRLKGLSRPSDALPALSGLAASFCQAMGFQTEDYVAGLWRQNLFEGVAWTLMPPASSRAVSLADAVKRATCPGEVRTPSWSWVGRGEVSALRFPNTKPMCKIKTRVVHNGPNQFGEIASASFRITGKVGKLPCDLEKMDRSPKTVPRPNWWQADDGTHQWLVGIDWDPNRSPEPAGELRMIFTGNFSHRKKGLPRRFFGLLTHEVGAARPGVFVRVGCFMSLYTVRRSARHFISGCTTETIEIV